MNNKLEVIMSLNGRQYSVKAPIGRALEPGDIEQAKQDILSGKISTMNPATCHDVVQGTTQQITLTATGGQANYTYKLLLDGIQIASAGPMASTSHTFSVAFNQAIGNHTLKGEIIDSCATPQTASDQCTFDITASVGSISCTTTPSGASVALDGVSLGVVTPVTLTDVSAGSHTVTFTLSGYNSCQASVTVTAGSTATASCTLTAITNICTWITNNGGVSGMTIPKIFNLVDAYIGVTNIGFTPTNQQIFGCVDYYLGFITSGNSKTGCSF